MAYIVVNVRKRCHAAGEVLPGSQVRAHQQRGFCSERGGTQNARTYSTSPTSVITCQIAPSSPVRVGCFLLSQKYFFLSEYTYSTVSYPYSTHFPKLTVFYRIHQERTRIHKNTSMWKSVSAIFIESARIPQNTDRIPRRVGILQEFTQNTEAFRIPLKNTARNTQKNTVFFIVFRIRPRIRYFSCRIPTSIYHSAFGAFARPCRRILDEGARKQAFLSPTAIEASQSRRGATYRYTHSLVTTVNGTTGMHRHVMARAHECSRGGSITKASRRPNTPAMATSVPDHTPTNPNCPVRLPTPYFPSATVIKPRSDAAAIERRRGRVGLARLARA